MLCSIAGRSRLPAVPECIISTALYHQPVPPPPPLPPPPPGAEDPRTWLERQKMKLVSRRAGGGTAGQPGTVGFGAQSGMDPERAEQQRRLVEELKSAQSILMRRRAAAADTDSSSTDHDQHQKQITSASTTQNGIHADKPKVPAADAPWTKKPRSEMDVASDLTKVCVDFRCQS